MTFTKCPLHLSCTHTHTTEDLNYRTPQSLLSALAGLCFLVSLIANLTKENLAQADNVIVYYLYNKIHQFFNGRY